jgi:hypothetical protein
MSAPSTDRPLAWRRPQAVERGSRGDTLERPGLRKPLGRGEPHAQIGGHQRVTELTRSAGGAAINASAEHEAAADAGPDGDHHEVFGDHSKLLVVSLGECRDRRVVVDEHRNPEPLPQHLANRDIDERHVDGRDHPSSLELHH